MKSARILTCVAIIAGLGIPARFAFAQAPCLGKDQWFPHSNTPLPSTADPALGAGNCGFHQWSWQMFLWLTQVQPDGRLRFVDMPPPSAIAPIGAAPVTSYADRPKSKLRLTAALATVEGTGPFGEFQQAGSGPDGVLIGRNGRVAYYSQHINDAYYNFVTKDNLLNTYANYQSQGGQPAKVNPNTVFPPGALELKAAWRVIEPGEPTQGFYTSEAEVDALMQPGGPGTEIKVNRTSPPLTATVALVGLHVVGIVDNHPEFIWATFEHKDNTPDLPPGSLPTTPVSNKDFTFYTANTTVENSQPFKGSVPLTLSGQKVSPVTNAYRLHPWGGPTDLSLVQSLNDSVHQKLGSDPIWTNYNEIGAVWLIPGGLKPNINPVGIAVGSTQLENSVIETFRQAKDQNCFACHETTRQGATSGNGPSIPPTNLNISHALMNQLLTQGAAATPPK